MKMVLIGHVLSIKIKGREMIKKRRQKYIPMKFFIGEEPNRELALTICRLLDRLGYNTSEVGYDMANTIVTCSDGVALSYSLNYNPKPHYDWLTFHKHIDIEWLREETVCGCCGRSYD